MEEARLRRRRWRRRGATKATNGTLRCVTLALPPDVRAVELEVSLNGQQFTRDGVRFTIEKDPKYKGHTPSAPNGYAEGSIFARAARLVDVAVHPGRSPRPSTRPTKNGHPRRSRARRRRAAACRRAERRRRAEHVAEDKRVAEEITARRTS